MVKITGKLFIVFMLACGILNIHASVTLKAFDAYGGVLDKIGMGQSFTLEVAVQGVSALQDKPTIKGLESFYVRDNGLMSISVNGNSTIKYTYKVRIDTPGHYAIGPAIAIHNNQKLVSKPIVVNVVDQPVLKGKSDQKNGQSNIAFLRFKTDKLRAVVGEKIVCHLRFYYTDEVVNVSPITHADVIGFKFDANALQSKGVERVNDIDYTFFEITWNAYATQPGKKLIPPYAMDFAVRSAKPYHSALAMFFGQGALEQKRVYSNSVALLIDPLPPHTGPVQAIGSFTHFNAKIEPPVAKQGEGMVLTLELVGDGVFDTTNNPITLHNVPPSLKYYDSKNYGVDKINPQDPTKHNFEFIVQALQKGDWQIPSQEFTFFDVHSRTYKTLKTMPLAVMVMPQAGNQYDYKRTHTATMYEDPAFAAQNDIAPIVRVRPVLIRQKVQMLPWWLFFICLTILVGAVLAHYMKTIFSSSVFGALTKRNAFKVARAQLQTAARAGKPAEFYRIFIKLFAVRGTVDESVVDIAYMCTRLASLGVPEVQIAQWRNYFSQLEQYVFFSASGSAADQRVLVEQNNRWIALFEKVL